MSTTWIKITPDEARQHKLYGTSGWLIVFSIGLLIGIASEFALAHTVGISFGELLSDNNPAISYYLKFAIEVLAIVAIYWALFTKAPFFRKFTSGVLVGLFPLVSLVGYDLSIPDFGIALVKGAASWAISCAVWVTYLQKSKRVRVTFEHCIQSDDPEFKSHITTRENSRPQTVSTTSEKVHDTVKIPPSRSLIPSPNFADSKFENGLSPMNDDTKNEEEFWATAMAELEVGPRRQGLWAKAFAESNGDETKSKVAYLKARVQQLMAAENAAKVEQEADLKKASSTEDSSSISRESDLKEAISLFARNKDVSDEQISLIVLNAESSILVSLCNTYTGNTLLHLCAKRGMVREFKMLLEAGADPSRSNNNGVRPEYMTENELIKQLCHNTREETKRNE